MNDRTKSGMERLRDLEHTVQELQVELSDLRIECNAMKDKLKHSQLKPLPEDIINDLKF